MLLNLSPSKRDGHPFKGGRLNYTLKKKSKIMFIGNWAGREESPFPWLQVVKELKVFGLVLTPNYSTTLSQTWEGVQGVQEHHLRLEGEEP